LYELAPTITRGDLNCASWREQLQEATAKNALFWLTHLAHRSILLCLVGVFMPEYCTSISKEFRAKNVDHGG
jgi:hypothetical protein